MASTAVTRCVYYRSLVVYSSNSSIGPQ